VINYTPYIGFSIDPSRLLEKLEKLEHHQKSYGKDLEIGARNLPLPSTCRMGGDMLQGKRTTPTSASTECGQLRNDAWTIVDPADNAVLQIVSMGFTPSEAREALMSTDNGVHHSVHLAVEHLLRRSTYKQRV
jgi:hypothetical protein